MQHTNPKTTYVHYLNCKPLTTPAGNTRCALLDKHYMVCRAKNGIVYPVGLNLRVVTVGLLSHVPTLLIKMCEFERRLGNCTACSSTTFSQQHKKTPMGQDHAGGCISVVNASVYRKH